MISVYLTRLTRRAATLLGACLLLAASNASLSAQSGRPAPSETVREILATGRMIRIIEPKTWNGRVVIDAYGFGASSSTWADSLWAVLRAQGYAIVAPSSRAESGSWALSEVKADVYAINEEVVRRYGSSARLYVVGHSAAAYAALASAETPPRSMRGALAFCPLTATLDAPDVLVDVLVGFDFYFPGVLTRPGSTLANVRVPQPAEILSALTRSPDRALQFARAIEVKPTDLPATVAYYADVLGTVQRQTGGNPVDLRRRQFPLFGSDIDFERRVTRFAADSAAARRAGALIPPLTGRLGTPVLIVHTAYDPLIPTRSVRAYVSDAVAAGSGSRIVFNHVVGEGHCSISFGQRVAALERLVRWSENGVVPPSGALPPASVSYPEFEPGPTTEIDGRWLRLGVVNNGRPVTPEPKVVRTWDHGISWWAVNDVPNAQRERIVVRPNASPKEVDTFDLLGNVSKGIYELRGDTLRFTWFLGDRVYPERPRDFTASGQWISTFRRIAPR